MLKRHGIVMPVVALAALAAPAFGHNAICDCFIDEENPSRIICEGGFSDGSSAAGIPVHIVDRQGKVLIDGAMDEMSEFAFSRPDVDFHVEFDAGEGHVIRIDGRDIDE